jgi:peptidoglycan hydrolase CwlO-like protein
MMKIVNLMLLYICYANAFIPSTNVLNKINIPSSNICSSKKVIYNAVSLLRASIYNNKQKKWEPPIGYIPDSQKKWKPPIDYTPKQKEIVNSIDRDIEDLFDEDALFTDISRETKYINNKFDKLLNDIEHMKNTVENIKKHNNIIHTKSKYYNTD